MNELSPPGQRDLDFQIISTLGGGRALGANFLHGVEAVNDSGQTVGEDAERGAHTGEEKYWRYGKLYDLR